MTSIPTPLLIYCGIIAVLLILATITLIVARMKP